MARVTIHLGKFEISESSPCFVIAEIGQNHQGDVSIAKKIIDAAAANGANAVKIQKRDNKSLYTKAMYAKPYDNENSFGATYGEHREALEFGKEAYIELKAHAESKGLVFFATAFDIKSADFLEGIGVPAYKIASGDVTNTPLLEHVAKKGKPVFISTGASNIDEVDDAYQVLRDHTDQVCILQCTSVYPAEPSDINLNVIDTYLSRYKLPIIGFSSHDNGIVLPVIAYVKGARVVEKHFTLNRAMKGADHKFSLEPEGMRKMTRDLARAREALGSPEKVCYKVELPAKEKLGKSLFFARDMAKGTQVFAKDIAIKSPGNGIPPSKLNCITGAFLAVDVKEDQMIDKNNFEPCPRCARGHN